MVEEKPIRSTGESKLTTEKDDPAEGQEFDEEEMFTEQELILRNLIEKIETVEDFLQFLKALSEHLENEADEEFATTTVPSYLDNLESWMRPQQANISEIPSWAEVASFLFIAAKRN